MTPGGTDLFRVVVWPQPWQWVVIGLCWILGGVLYNWKRQLKSELIALKPDLERVSQQASGKSWVIDASDDLLRLVNALEAR